MKVELNNKGKFVLTAETEHDNVILFSVTNSQTLNGIQLRYPTKGNKVSLQVNEQQLPVKTRKKLNFKSCPVEGCEHRAKYISLHTRLKHGIWDNVAHEEVFQNAVGHKVKVAEPVVKLPDGTFKLRQVKGLLD